MVSLHGALSGTHPLGEELIQSILDFKYGRNNEEPVRSILDQEIEDLISFQSDLGFPTISSGNMAVEDLIRPFTRSLSSFHSYDELGDLPINRYHYTNTFYRQPQLIEAFPENGSVVVEDKNTITDQNSYHHIHTAPYSAKIVLPGPFSLLSMVDTKEQTAYSTYTDMIHSAATYLASEINNLPSNYVEVQLDDPFLVWDRIPRTLRPDIEVAYQTLTSKISEKNLIVQTYFESAEPILSFLLELPVDGIGIDFTKTNVLSLLDYDFSDKILQAGVVNAQNFVPDASGSLDTTTNNFLSKYIATLVSLEPRKLIITPTTGLEYLPRKIADQILEQISNVISKVKEEN